MKKTILWFNLPEDHDYPAALSYLSLIMEVESAKAVVKMLQDAPITYFNAKDICRAAGLPMLGIENRHVAKNLSKIETDKQLSPILLVRGENQKLIIADGYHRTCAVHHFNEDAVVPAKLV